MSAVADDEFMRLALCLAERGRPTTSPNPMVGCVIVAPDGVRVGAGAHERAGEPHAEILALREAGARARGATLYVSLEPCAHTGRTGPCVAPIVDAGIRRVVAAVQDPHPAVSGKGFAFLRSHGVDVTLGVREAQARALNEAFFVAVTQGRPHVTLKVAVSADGFVAGPGGGPTAISSPESLRHAHAERAHVDALAVGVGTILSDDPLLTARGVYRHRPLMRVIFDSHLRTPASARIWQTRAVGPIVLVCSAEVLDTASARVKGLADLGGTCVPTRFLDVADALRGLDRRLVRSLIVEGGPTLHRAMWDAGVVDRLRVYQSPVHLGNGVRWSIEGLRHLATMPGRQERLLGPDLLTDVDVHRTR